MQLTDFGFLFTGERTKCPVIIEEYSNKKCTHLTATQNFDNYESAVDNYGKTMSWSQIEWPLIDNVRCARIKVA